MTAYRVVATRLDQLLEDGTEVKHRAGSIVKNLSKSDVARHLASGNIVPDVDEEFEAPYDDSGVDTGDAKTGEEGGQGNGGSGDGGSPQPVPKPPSVANKAALVEWLVEHGTKHGGTREELEELTKDQLWEYIHAEE